MDLVESDKDETVGETTIRRATDVRPNNQPAGIAWLRALSMILVAIILVVLIVLFARWVYHKAHNNSIKTPSISTTSKTSTSTSSSSTKSESGASSNSSKTNSGQSSSSSSSGNQPSTSPNSQTTQNGQLPNNGPGNVMAVFVGASLAAGGVHYLVTIRRTKQI